MIKITSVKILYLLQIIIFVLLGILFYFSYQNKSSWDMQVGINDTLMKKKTSSMSPTWRLQLDINEVVMERFRWIGEGRAQWKIGESRPQQKIRANKLQKGELQKGEFHED